MRRKQFVLLRHITKLPVNDFKWVKDISGFDESFIKSYDEETDEGNFPANDSQYPESLHNLHNDLSFLLERMKIEKVEEKPITNLLDKTEYVTQIKKNKTKIKLLTSFEKNS